MQSKPMTMTEARDKYVDDKVRDLLFDMKATQVPKGVWFSTFVMSFPLFAASGYLAAIAPIAANSMLVDPSTLGYTARTCVRLLSLNLTFLGGIHYGLASAQWDTARDSKEERKYN